MVFSDQSTRGGLIQECERICGLGAGGIAGTLLQDFTARINNALDRFYSLAFQYDELWNLDDRRYSDSQELPIATTSLVSGQQDYLFSSELLALVQVFIKDSVGEWKEIVPQDDRTSPNAYIGVTSGVPKTYDLVGNSILLNPTPNYNSDNGLKVIFKRNGNKFSSSDGSVAVGIPSLFHPYLAREASLPYLIEKNKNSAPNVANQIMKDEEALKKFISTRAKPKRVRLTPNKENNK